MDSLLNYVEAIYPLSNPLKIHLRKHIQSKRVLKNEFILKAGNVSKNIYFIERGLLRTFYLKKDLEISSWFMKEGDFIISVSSFLKQVTSNESIHALEDCLLYSLSYNELQNVYRIFPEFNFIGRVITEKYYALSEDRRSALKMMRANERYDYLMENHGELLQRVPLKYIASYLGVTEVTLGRSRFKK